MLKCKKMLSFVLAFVFVFSMMATAFAAPRTAEDIANSKYKEAIETLKGLNIMVGDDDGAFRPNDPIKRSEITKLAIILLGLEEVAASSTGQTKFPDVAQDHWATGYINTAASQGVIVGDDLGNFRPDENIIYNDVVTILVRALGYEPYANTNGGYPGGYLAAANYNGLTKNAASAGNQPVAREIVAQLVYNALTIQLMEQKNFGNDASFEIVDKTILEDKLSYTKISGIVTGTFETELTEKGSIAKNKIKIGDTIYSTEESRAAQYLGYLVTAYAKTDDYGDKKVALIRKDEIKNQELSVLAENLETISGNKVSYFENRDTDKKAKEITLDTKAALIYNGVASEMSAFALPFEGKAVFVDNNNDSKYDVVFMHASRNLVVEDVAPASHRVMDKYGNKGLTLDPEDEDVHFTLTDTDGNTVDLKDLVEWNVLTVTESKDGSVIRAVVSTEKIEGTVSAVKNNAFKIGDKDYKLAANYTAGLSLRDEGVFYLDAMGKIAAVDKNGSIAQNYAFLQNAAEISEDFEQKLQFKLYTTDGKSQVVTASDKIKFNRESGRTNAQILDGLKADGSVVPQLVTYELNAAGQVSALNTAVDKTADKLGHNKGVFTLSYASDEATFRKTSKKLDKIVVRDDAVVFDIPQASRDTSEYAVRDGAFFSDNAQYDVKVYDLNEDLSASVIVVSSAEGSTTAESPIAVVKEVSEAENSEGEIVQMLTALYDGKEVQLYTVENNLLEKDGQPLAEGDIIQFRQNANGEIDKISLLFDVAEKATELTDTSVTDLVLLYGKVDKKFATTMNITVNDGAPENFSFADARIYVVDTQKSRNKVSVGDAADIERFDDQQPSRVFVKIYKDEVQEIVVVK